MLGIWVSRKGRGGGEEGREERQEEEEGEKDKETEGDILRKEEKSVGIQCIIVKSCESFGWELDMVLNLLD